MVVRKKGIKQPAQAALSESEERYRRLVELCPDTIIVHTAQRIVTINPAGARLLGGRDPQALLGKSILTFIPPEKHPAVQDYVDAMYKGGEPFHQRQRKLVRLDGTVIDVEVSGAPVRYGGQAAAQIIVRDLTRRHKVEQHLSQLGQMSENMVAMVAHELRTPLTLIQGYASFLRDGDAGPVRVEQEELLDIIIRNSQRLATMVNTFLDLEKIEAGMFVMDRRYFSLDSLLQELNSAFQIEARNKGVSFCVACEQEVLAYGDRNQLFRALANLLSNALHFTETGTVSLKAYQRSEHVAIEVEDEGVGIESDDLVHIFDKFYQSKRQRSRHTNKSSGLGLTIAKAIVTEHGGTLSVHSELGVGTTFTLTLPTPVERRKHAAAPYTASSC